MYIQTMMVVQEWFLALAIAMIYYLFFNKLSDIVTGKTQVDRMCDSLNQVKPMEAPSQQQMGAIDACYKEQSDKRQKVTTNQFYILLTISVLSLILSLWMNEGAASSGLSFGSILVLLTVTSSYWGQMDELMKLGTTGVALFVLLAVSTKMFNLSGGLGGLTI